jgi:hypothetical protein
MGRWLACVAVAVVAAACLLVVAARDAPCPTADSTDCNGGDIPNGKVSKAHTHTRTRTCKHEQAHEFASTNMNKRSHTRKHRHE